jgi:hypothetical protein
MRERGNRSEIREPARSKASATATIILAFLGVTGCASQEYVYKIYGGPARSDAEIAVVNLDDAMGAVIAERKVAHSDYARVQLLPGTYPIYWECLYGVSVMIEPSGFATGAESAEVALEAGHVYSLHCDRTTGYGYQTYQWIRDDTVGRIVAGEKKP